MASIQRKIEEIFNNDKGKAEKASVVLDKIVDQDDYVRLRRELRIRNKENNPLYKCDECGTELELSCTPNELGQHTFYFKHIKDPAFDECSIKTDSNRSAEEILKRQYAFKSESNAHIFLKREVGEIIRWFIDPNVIVDKQFIKDKFGDTEKRKPDVYFRLDDQEITIEFQVNNTFHSVIQERESFYERNKISLIWVFAEFEPGSFQSIAIKDIYIPNGNNAFVFDEEAKQASHEQQKLVLKVFYKKYMIYNETVDFEWKSELIDIGQLKYDSITLRPFYFNCNADRQLAQDNLDNYFKEKKEKKLISGARKLAADLLIFLSRHKQNDTISEEHDYELLKLKCLKEIEINTLNQEVNLNRLFKGNNNIIQSLLYDNKLHYNLVSFLLKADVLNFPIEAINVDNKSTFIAIMEIYPNSNELVQILFARGYKLSKHDRKYINSIFSGIELKRINFLLKAYEKLNLNQQLKFFQLNLNEFLVIESSKQGKLVIIGKENQSLIWLANLAAVQYQKFWYYFDYAFKYYGFYEILFKMQNNASFLKNYNHLKNQQHQRNIEFEEILFVLYPELIHP